MRRPATDINTKQRRILDFIKDSLHNEYRCPTVREICTHVGLSSTSTVQSHLNAIGTVQAGMPITAVENLESTLTLPVQLTGDSDCFLLRVQGESMMNIGMYEGDMLIVRHQNTANNGDIVVARIDDEATVKRFYKENGHIRLQPENDNFDPIIVDDCHIEGLVIGLVRDRI